MMLVLADRVKSIRIVTGNKSVNFSTMRNLSFALLLLLFASASPIHKDDGPTSAECKAFHTGTFYDKSEPDVTIVRDDQTQTETDKDGKYIRMKIVWTDDCTYQLSPLKTNSRKFKKAWKKIKVLITECDGDNSYRYAATSNAIPVPIIGRIVRKK